MVVNNPGKVAGQVLDWTGCKTSTAKKGAGVITRGNICVTDTALTPDGWKKPAATANLLGPFSMSTQTTTSAATEFEIAEGGVCCLVSDGAMEINTRGATSGSVAAAIAAFTPSDVTGTPSEATIEVATLDFDRVVGRILGHADNYHTTAPTASVDTETVAVRMRKV